jgi:hypothetical protein
LSTISSKKEKEGDLSDRSKAPKHSPNKVASEIEDKVIRAKNKTRMGAKRLSNYLKKYEGLTIPYGTIRHILARNKDKIKHKISFRKHERREFVDWYSAKPFEIVQIDIKEIRDLKALSKAQIIHLDKFDIPNYQWGAIDVNSRFKLIAYSKEKTWTNGLCFYLWVISWLRGHGIQNEIVFTVDRGEEFGGKSWLKVKELRKLISAFGCRLIQNRKGHSEDNSHLERSHRTDDEEFHTPRMFKISSEEDLFRESLNYYDCVREHFSLNDKTPFQCLKEQMPELDNTIKLVPPIMLDHVSTKIGFWSGYNVLAQNFMANFI